MPKLRQLEYLVALADARTFREAARAVHVSQPTLTQQVQVLESRIGAQLVKRKTNPVELTPIGREVVRRARHVLAEVADIRNVARTAHDAVAGIVKLGISATIGPYLLPGVVSQLHRAHPDLRLHLVEGLLGPQLAALRRGELDLMVATKAVTGADLASTHLFDERLCLVVAPDHPFAAQSEVTPAELANAEVIGLRAGHALQERIEAICAAYRMRLEYDYEGSSLDSVCQMVASGLAMAILPELYLRSAVGGRNVVDRLAVTGWDERRPITALWRRRAGNLQAGDSQVGDEMPLVIARALRVFGRDAVADPA